MAITRTAIAREIPPQAARTAPRNEAHQLSRPKFRQNRYVPKKPARSCLASSPFAAQLPHQQPAALKLIQFELDCSHLLCRLDEAKRQFQVAWEMWLEWADLAERQQAE